MGIRSRILESRIFNHPLIGKYASLVREDLSSTFSSDIQKWLIVAPLIGICTGPLIAGLEFVILKQIWYRVLPAYIAHHWLIVPTLTAGFILTGLIMRYFTPDPNEHTTEEVVKSYHEHGGDIDTKSFWWKTAAEVATIGSGGSAALEGPSIYTGATAGSWLWTKLRRFGLDPRDRRIMLISGAAAGMGAVFRAPLTGMIFAIEMPYKDDLAHEAVMPSLISSVVAYAMMVAFTGSQPLFGFVGSISFSSTDLLWSALLGAVVGVIALVYDITFRRVRTYFIARKWPHALKLAIGGLGTGLCGLLFVTLYPGNLIPLGPNYEAVGYVLRTPYPPVMLATFAALKMGATIFSLGSGGVSAMFVPLLLIGGTIGSAFAQSVVHARTIDLFVAVGMAAFIAAGYKTVLTSVVFVAETTGGHSFIIPSLIGAAVAFAISGTASVSGDQRLHEATRLAGLDEIDVADAMQREVATVASDMTVARFMSEVVAGTAHTMFPVCVGRKPIGIVSLNRLSAVPVDRWDQVTVGAHAEHHTARVEPDCDLMEALRMLTGQHAPQMLMVVSREGMLQGIITKTDILRAFSHSEGRKSPALNHVVT